MDNYYSCQQKITVIVDTETCDQGNLLILQIIRTIYNKYVQNSNT